MTFMRRHIVLATDLGARCDRAFDRAVLLARAWDARLTIVHALESETPAGRGVSLRWRGIDREISDAEAEIQADLRRAGMAADVLVRPGSAPALVAELARRMPCDLIVSGVSRSSALARAIRGSTVEALARNSAAPVLTVSRPARGAYAGVVVGTNFSAGSRAALQATLALFPGVDVTTLHAYRRPRESMAGGSGLDAMYQHLQGASARFVSEAVPARWQEIRRRVEIGFPETQLNDYAVDRGLDLIAVGLEDRNPLATFLVGGTIEPLARMSACDVLIVPAKWRSSAGSDGRSGDHPRAQEFRAAS